MIDLFQRNIVEENLLSPGDKVLLAVSGGVDSVVMADLFSLCDYQWAIAHCNYQLRGQSSDEDEQFVSDLATKMHIDCFTKKFDISPDSGDSVQMQARDMRYNWFERLSFEHGYQFIATAHHKDDVIETILLNLIKGTGIAGLRGILPRSGNLIRPLLFATKSEIMAYARERALKWREDHSNTDNKYQRNYIRNELVPVLKNVNPSFREAILTTSHHLRDVEMVYQHALKNSMKSCISTKNEDYYLDLKTLEKEPHWELLLSGILHYFGMNKTQIEQLKNVRDHSGAIFETGDWIVNVDRNQLVISAGANEDTCIEIEEDDDRVSISRFELILQKRRDEKIKPSESPSLAYLDLELVQFPLTLRTWRPGDCFVPLGMSGKKKVSDFMIDQKIPLNLKKRQLVLFSGDEIVWVVGQRISENYKITDRTRSILEIKIIPKNAEPV